MRIISGRYRGLKLAEFVGGDIRPTSDRAKESLFNILGAGITGARVLDLFCGSGNVGLEALSRGAEIVRFNDFSRASLSVLRKNLAKFKGGERYEISEQDYLSCLCSAKEKFDFIFIDPPYKSDFGVKALQKISERKILSESGIAVFESGEPFLGDIYGLELYDKRKYGKACFSFFRNKSDD